MNQAYASSSRVIIPLARHGKPSLSTRSGRLARIGGRVACWVLAAVVATGSNVLSDEPNMHVASGWWPEIENVWTPIGWKDHPLRFNVIYNGILMGVPMRQPSWGPGVQLTFIPSADGALPAPRPNTNAFVWHQEDGGHGEQGWNEGAAPVLWTEWHQDGLKLRAEVFGHVPGGGPAQTGREPLFAWVRLSIHDVEGAGQKSRYGWLVKLNRPHIQVAMERERNLTAYPARAKYPVNLTAENGAGSLLVLEPDGKVRLAAVADKKTSMRFIDKLAERGDAFLHIDMPCRKGAYADLLVPFISPDRAIFDQELRDGLRKALAETERFWAKGQVGRARIDTPEALVNQAFRVSPRFAEVVAEKNPANGQYSMLSGAWGYEALWATPTSMNITMVLDLLGYHDVAEKYLEIFHANQGTVTPPGGHYKRHPGYLSTPKTLTSVDWLTDHGAILYAVCHHGLLTDDKRFIDHWMPTIIRACEFIRDSRASTGHGGVEGIMPSAVPTDTGVAVQAVWSDGWNYKGLITAARLLERCGNPRAKEFSEVARDYREAFNRAMRESAKGTPEWTDAKGVKHHFAPTALPDGGDLQHPFYLDGGPLFLVYSGLMNAEDDLMQSALLYFREGPNTKKYNLNGNWAQAISLRHEMSSCEPCYSWNNYHSHQTGDREHYLEGMYSLFAGALSRHTSIGCEHRGGMGGTLFSSCMTLDLARLAVIDDEIKADELHLLRMVPLAWLTADHRTTFEKMPTEFGPVNVQFQLRNSGKRLAVWFDPRFRVQPRSVVLHVPPVDTIQEVTINNQTTKAAPGDTLNVPLR